MSPVSIVIPTYGRGQVLVDTISYLLRLETRAEEILIVDQTTAHEASVAEALAGWDRESAIRWVRQSTVSIPNAMNRGLQEARHEIVLFLDDDIVPDAKLVEAHERGHLEQTGNIVAGRILQPWHDGQPDPPDRNPFGFNALEPHDVEEFMGGNFSLRRKAALQIGGFDENFVRVAYRFEAEFAHRWRRSGRSIRYEPTALIHHLKAGSGGTRSFGGHLTTIKPDHAVGAYYFLLRTSTFPTALMASFKRLVRSVMTRHHLRQPWWIPMTFVAELGGMAWASILAMRGPRYITPETGSG
ncbi:MAG: glycosyltransferase family A protein [Pseudomonadota bacterium]